MHGWPTERSEPKPEEQKGERAEALARREWTPLCPIGAHARSIAAPRGDARV